MADSIFKFIFEKENILISNIISLKFIPQGPIVDKSGLVYTMALLKLIW